MITLLVIFYAIFCYVLYRRLRYGDEDYSISYPILLSIIHIHLVIGSIALIIFCLTYLP